LYNPTVVIADPGGSLFIAEASNHRVRRVAAGTRVITTVAGNGVARFSGDGGAATSASIRQPEGLALDRAGNLFMADYDNHRVRKVAAGTGIITTVAGDGVARFSGDGGPATSASVHIPHGLAFDQEENLMIVDHANRRIRRVAAGTGIITTVAGSGGAGFSGDGGAATSASLHDLVGIILNPAGNIFIIDRSNHRVRTVSAPTRPSSTPSASPSSTPYCPPSLFRPLPRTDLVGTLVGSALAPGDATLVASVAACRQACCDAPVCDGFSFDANAARSHAESSCFLYANVTQLIPSSGYASGVLESAL